MPGLCGKLNLTPDQVMFDLYGPQALQYVHAILFAGDAWTVAPAASVNRQAQLLRSGLGERDELLGL